MAPSPAPSLVNAFPIFSDSMNRTRIVVLWLAMTLALVLVAGPGVAAPPELVEFPGSGPAPGRTLGPGSTTVTAAGSSQVIGKIDPGSTVLIMGRSGSSYRIAFKNQVAHIPASRVLTTAAGPYGTGSLLRTTVGPGGARLCRRPGGDTIASLLPGTPLEIEARTLDWILVRTPRGMGYVPIQASLGGSSMRFPTGTGDGVVLRLHF